MSDVAYLFLVLIGVALASAVPLIAYALLPQEGLAIVSEHGRFGGLGQAEQAERPSGNSSLPSAGSLQGQIA